MHVSRQDFTRATHRLTMCNRARSARTARRVLHRLWNVREGVLVGLAVPSVPAFAAESLTRAQRTRLLATGREELAALPFRTLTPERRLQLSKFYGGPGAPDPGAKHTRRLTFPMLVVLLGLDGARIVGELWAGKRLPPREALDARHPDPDEAARIHGRALARTTRQRAAQRADGHGLHVIGCG
jgi:hypothetical protein